MASLNNGYLDCKELSGQRVSSEPDAPVPVYIPTPPSLIAPEETTADYQWEGLGVDMSMIEEITPPLDNDHIFMVRSRQRSLTYATLREQLKWAQPVLNPDTRRENTLASLLRHAPNPVSEDIKVPNPDQVQSILTDYLDTETTQLVASQVLLHNLSTPSRLEQWVMAWRNERSVITQGESALDINTIFDRALELGDIATDTPDIPPALLAFMWYWDREDLPLDAFTTSTLISHFDLIATATLSA